MELENSKLQDKCNRQHADLKELRHLSEENERLGNRIKFFESEITKLEANCKHHMLDIQKLKTLEFKMNQVNEACEEKEKKILNLIKENHDLEASYSSISSQLNTYRYEAKENLENEMCKSAKLEGDLNLVRQQFNNFKEESQNQQNEMQKQVIKLILNILHLSTDFY